MSDYLTATDRAELEGLIDRVGLHAVVGAIADICGEKAEHLRTYWQDNNSAHAWDGASKRLAHVSDLVSASVS